MFLVNSNRNLLANWTYSNCDILAMRAVDIFDWLRKLVSNNSSDQLIACVSLLFKAQDGDNADDNTSSE